MTRSEYQELVEFLGRRFDAIDQRFDAVETRLTRVEVTTEQNLHYIRIVAEGLSAHRESSGREFAAVRREMADGFQGQEGLLQELNLRVERLERRCA